MTFSFTEYMGLVLSWITEVFSLSVFEWQSSSGDVSITFGQILLFCTVVPVMYKLLFPSPS